MEVPDAAGVSLVWEVAQVDYLLVVYLAEALLDVHSFGLAYMSRVHLHCTWRPCWSTCSPTLLVVARVFYLLEVHVA